MLKPTTWRLGGGLDLTTPQTLRSKHPGSLIAALNYEDRKEGYRRIDGFERFDGRPTPSSLRKKTDRDAARAAIEMVPGKGELLGVWRYRGNSYAFTEALNSQIIEMYVSSPTGWQKVPIDKLIGFTLGGGRVPVPHQTIKGRTSEATATVQEIILQDGSWANSDGVGVLVVRAVVGTFQADEVLVIGQEAGDGAVSVGAIITGSSGDFAGYRYNLEPHLQVGNSHVEGDYPDLEDFTEFGVENQNLVLVVSTPDDEGFFDDKEIYVEFPSNRRAVYRFSAAKVVEIENHVQYSWPLLGAQYLNPPLTSDRIVFRIRQLGYQPQSTTMTAAGPPVDQRIIAGPESRFRFTNRNFFGQAHQERMYGVSGSGPAFEFDGRTFFSLHTGAADDRPILVSGHRKHLFLGYRGGSVIHSGTGKPRNFEAIEGAVEIATGDELTGMLSGYKGVLILSGRNRTDVLKGKTPQSWDLDTLSEEAGAMWGTLVEMESPVCFDDRGIREIEATLKFGDLSIGYTSEHIRPLLDRLREGGVMPVSAVRVRNKSQYRIWFDDGRCLVVRHDENRGGKVRAFTVNAYRVEIDGNKRRGIVTNVCSVEDPDGRERIFATMKGSRYVYELDKGDSFDGLPISAFLQLPFNDMGQPYRDKHFSIVLVEATARRSSRFKIWFDFDDKQMRRFKSDDSYEILTELGVWGESHWGEFQWAGAAKRLAEARVDTRGRNLSIMIVSVGEENPPHTVTGVTAYWHPARVRLSS